MSSLNISITKGKWTEDGPNKEVYVRKIENGYITTIRISGRKETDLGDKDYYSTEKEYYSKTDPSKNPELNKLISKGTKKIVSLIDDL